MKLFAVLVGDLWSGPLNTWPCKDGFYRQLLSPTSVNWKTVTAEVTGLFNLLYIPLSKVQLSPCKDTERNWRMTG